MMSMADKLAEKTDSKAKIWHTNKRNSICDFAKRELTNCNVESEGKIIVKQKFPKYLLSVRFQNSNHQET